MDDDWLESAYEDAQNGAYDDDPNPYHGNYSEGDDDPPEPPVRIGSVELVEKLLDGESVTIDASEGDVHIYADQLEIDHGVEIERAFLIGRGVMLWIPGRAENPIDQMFLRERNE